MHHRIRRNADRTMRDLQRRLASGEIPATPETGYQLYLQHRRGGEGRREFQRSPVEVIDTPLGRLHMVLVGDTISLSNRNNSSDYGEKFEDPWEINRVPIYFSQYAKVSEDGVWRVEVSHHGVYRADGWRPGWSASQSLKRNLGRALEGIVNEWVAVHAGELTSGELVDVDQDIRREEEQIAQLEQQLHEHQLKIGELFLKEIAIRGRAQGPQRNPRLSREQWDELVRMLLDYNWTYADAARHYRVSRQAISHHMKSRPYALRIYRQRHGLRQVR